MKMENIKFKATDFHSHLKSRMLQRGVTTEEVEMTIKDGWKADDAKTGTEGKVFVFFRIMENGRVNTLQKRK